LHARFLLFGYLDMTTGEIVTHRLEHENADTRKFQAGLPESARVGTLGATVRLRLSHSMEPFRPVGCPDSGPLPSSLRMMHVEILLLCLDGIDLVRRAGCEPAFPITGTGVLLLDDRRVSKLHR
jgi:hypothetical protein